MSPTIHTLPIFPLSTVVLFPGIRVPLHIFEPRYRQMTTEALAGKGEIGMVTVRPDHVGEMRGDPPLFDVGCAGRIVESEEMEDGRWNLVLLGTQRFRLHTEVPRDGARLYRLAEVEMLDDPAYPEERPRIQALRTEILEQFNELLRVAAPEGAARLRSEVVGIADDSTFVNVLSQILALPAPEKQGLLEADGILARLEALAAVLQFHMASWKPLGGAGPDQIH